MAMDSPLAEFTTGARHLTDDEQMFIYQLEVIGMPVSRAGEVSGIKSPYLVLKRPHVVAAREQVRIAMRQRTNFTREDVIAGIKKAVDQAEMMADPLAQIAGWREIGKLLGYDKTPNIHIHASGTIEQVRKQLQSMSTEDLMIQAGDGDVLDAGFYPVGQDGNNAT